MTIAIISHPDCALHDAGDEHPESPERVKVIQNALERYPFKSSIEFYLAPQATREQLELAHDNSYVSWIYSIAPEEGLVGIDADTWMNSYTLNAALRAAGAVVYAVDLVMQGSAKAAFCNIRPPGHHAEHDKAMGFCIFNNVAIGVAYALEKYGLQRIAVVDFDVHRGNGTQQIFQDDERVLYCSSFEHPLYPGYEEESDNQHILSVPLNMGTTGDVFREKVKAAWFDKLEAFKPQLIFFSAGFDAHSQDPIGGLKLTEADYAWVTAQVANIAKKYSAGKVISVLEGGYHLDALAQSVPAHVEALIAT